MKNYLKAFALSVLFVSCRTEQQKAMASADKNFILKVANEKFAKKKWNDAIALYERLPKLVAGTDDAPNVVFNAAYANYYNKNYKLAGSQFKNFSLSFQQDKRREEAAYMSALCYYEGSMDYNLDQSNTESAINELQEFINNFPNSDRSKNINQLIEELSYKLELKAFENARQYHKMGDFKAANVAFENVLDDFPGTKLRPRIYDYIMKSRYRLAQHSVYDLKDERIASAISYTKQVEKELPNTEYSKTAVDLREKLLHEKESFEKEKKDVEARKAEYLSKQKAEEAKLADKENEQDKKMQKDLRETRQARMDSAKTDTPKPEATFKIRR